MEVYFIKKYLSRSFPVFMGESERWALFLLNFPLDCR